MPHTISSAQQDDLADAAPRCLECDYILIGLSSDRCPECGTQIDWNAVHTAAENPGLPCEQRHGWGRLWGFVLTWLLVLFRPRHFARRLSDRTPLWPATAFALACMAIGITSHTAWVGTFDRYLLVWIIATWLHIELQSVMFFICEFRPHRWTRQWAFWRKLSLFTTAFVVLDIIGGPPFFEDYRRANFPWPLDPDFGHVDYWDSITNNHNDVARAIAYYWWMIVLTIALWIRMRRKWMLLFILAAMPGITMISCNLALHASELFWNAWGAAF